MAEERVAVYPGTFDPVTNGHVDIIRRASRLVDRLVIGVAANADKAPMFSLEERMAMVREDVAPIAAANSVVIDTTSFDNLLMHFAEGAGARIIIRGLRAVSDFDYEFMMVGMNARINADIETVFLMASESQQFIASRFVKEIAILGGDISSFVSANVARHLVTRAKEEDH